MLLALDTATPSTSVALIGHGQVLAERAHRDPRRHAEILVGFIDEVMTDSGFALADLDGIAVGVGPGAFTGLRVGLMTARALGMTLAVPVHGVMTLDALAFEAQLQEPFAVVTDARRREVFWARYNADGSRSAGPSVDAPGTVVDEVGHLPCVGAGETPFAELFDDVRGPDLPSASALGLLASSWLANGKPLLAPDPLYLRRPDVTPAGAAKSVLT